MQRNNSAERRGLFTTKTMPYFVICLTLILLQVPQALVAPNPVYAHDSFFGPRYPFGTPGNAATNAIASGDMDNDNDLDIIISSYETSAIYLNDGAGNFHNGPVKCGITSNVHCFSDLSLHNIVVGEINGDGNLDIVASSDDNQILVYLNDSFGNMLIGSTINVDLNDLSDIALGDLDNDGDIDIVMGATPSYSFDCSCYLGGQDIIYLNDGAGDFSFTRFFGTGSDRTYSIVVADMNNDASIDIVVSNQNSIANEQSVIYLNDGQGYFYNGQTVCNLYSSVLCFGDETNDPGSVAVGDMDNNGTLDLIATGENGFVYLNDGTADLYDGQVLCGETETVRCFGAFIGNIDVVDIDNDNDTDVIGSNAIYLNDGDAGFHVGAVICGVSPNVICYGSEEFSMVITAVDLNSDDNLDIIVGNSNDQDSIYFNRGSGNFTVKQSFNLDVNSMRNLAIGDIDNDTDLDVVVTTYQDNRVYMNNGQSNLSLSSVFDNGASNTTSIAMADIDNDNDLDAVVGNFDGPNVIYFNDGTGYFTAKREFGTGIDNTQVVNVGDVDADNDIDIIVGNSYQQSAIYLNDGFGGFQFGPLSCNLLSAVRCFGPTDVDAISIAIGDLDIDGDIDIVAGTRHQQNTIYVNDGTGDFSSVRLLGPDTYNTQSMALGDVDGDGLLDIIVGSYLQNVVYLNSGDAHFFAGELICGFNSRIRCFGNKSGETNIVVPADVDGDGDIDLVAGDFEAQSAVYLNDGQANFHNDKIACGFTPSVRCFGNNIGNVTSVAVGDMDGNGKLDIVGGHIDDQTAVYLNSPSGSPKSTSSFPSITLYQPGGSPASPFYSTMRLLDEPTISFQYKLFNATSDSVRRIRAFYSLDGGGRWLQAAAAPGTDTTDLSASPEGSIHTFVWDTFASGFFGQSDNVVFRIEAYPSYQMPGPYRRAYASAQTFPFRVRGSQVRVFGDQGEPATGVVAYRIRDGVLLGGLPFTLSNGQPAQTNAQGYLQGRGVLGFGDRLVAMQPISTTESYTLYYTSAAPNPHGLDAYIVQSSGVQTLTVSPANPLILFNLNISLEWDARTDPAFLSQLRYDLRRTSELLYDWSDGQAALGDIAIYQKRERWDDAHIRVYATNRLRPNANQGGIVGAELADPDKPQITYAPGQVRIGATWNRYGEASGTLGEDWPRTLAHELGHYAFFLDDNYLGIDAHGHLTQVKRCRGAMSDPYLPVNSEFHPASDWSDDCGLTLANQATGRSDWQTIARFYTHPELNFAPRAPAAYNANPGPDLLPLEVTRINEMPVGQPSDTLQSPVIAVTNPTGGRVTLSKAARAVLYRPDDGRLVDLGSPVLDLVTARGARPNDRLCVYDLGASQQGCDILGEASDHIAIYPLGLWKPDVVITPVTSTTLTISVTGVGIGRQLQAELYPTDRAAVGSIVLTPTASGYSGTFNLSEPVLAGHLRVWDTADDANPETVVDYALGGNPGYVRSRNSPRGSPGYVRSRNAPAVSTDGQVILYTDGTTFAPGTFYTVQATIAVSPPPWATVIGQSYRLSASPNAPSLNGSVLNIGYLGSDVPPGEEPWIKIYRLDGTSWIPLPTTLDQEHNEASTSVTGPGVYALMSSIEIGLVGPGWNNIAYPIHGTRPVTEALQSIDGAYTTIYGYDTHDSVDPWKVYDVSAPTWVNDLHELRFGQGYWIQATETITLYLHGPQPATSNALLVAGTPLGPPATYYGSVGTLAGNPPSEGLAVTARVNGVVCGQGRTSRVAGEIVYSVNVSVEGPRNSSGCGMPGRTVQIQIGNWVVPREFVWDNNQLHRVDITVPALLYKSPEHVYMPLVRQ
jgi:hypothetical protein